MADMKVVYLAGPYRASTEFGVHENIHSAGRAALAVWRMGAVCICPHKNTAYFGGELPDEVWLRGDRELIRRSDAVLMMDGSLASCGAGTEEAFAASIGKPVFNRPHMLHDWLRDYELVDAPT